MNKVIGFSVFVLIISSFHFALASEKYKLDVYNRHFILSKDIERVEIESIALKKAPSLMEAEVPCRVTGDYECVENRILESIQVVQVPLSYVEKDIFQNEYSRISTILQKCSL